MRVNNIAGRCWELRDVGNGVDEGTTYDVDENLDANAAGRMR